MIPAFATAICSVASDIVCAEFRDRLTDRAGRPVVLEIDRDLDRTDYLGVLSLCLPATIL